MKRFLCLICLAAMLLSLCGCMRSGLSEEPTTAPPSPIPEASLPEETPAPTTAPETVPVSEPQPILEESLFPMDFYFSSGAGGWGTSMTLNSDFSFSGSFHDSDMGDMTEEYPNGTCYISSFSGSFRVVSQIDEYSYSLELVSLETEVAEGTVWIEDGIRFIASEAFGLEGSEYVLYLPETPMEQLPEDLPFWLPHWEDTPETLSRYSIWNATCQTPFFTYD